MTGSAPKGNSGPSPRYSCTHCRASVLKAPVSIKRDVAHGQFIELLNRIQPTHGVEKLFKEIVIKKWNNEYKEALDIADAIKKELGILNKRRSRVLDLYIDEKISEKDKTLKLEEISNTVINLKARQSDSDNLLTDKETVIDGALLFMKQAGTFWELADSQTRQHIQQVIFPEGITLDCSTGFRTPIVNSSYLLISKIAQKGDLDSNLVAATRIELVTSGL